MFINSWRNAAVNFPSIRFTAASRFSSMNPVITDTIYQKVFEMLSEAVAIADPQGKVIMVNDELCRLTGFSREEWMQENGFAMVTGSDERISFSFPVTHSTSHTESSFHEEVFLKRKDGGKFWASLKITALRDEEGFLLGKMISIKDISGKKKQLAELRQTDDRLRFLLEASSEGIVIHEKGTIIDANDAAFKMFGYVPEDVIGKSIFDFVPPREHPHIIETIRKNLTTPVVREIYNKEGRIRTVELTGKTVSYNNQDVRIILLKDITELREKQLEEKRLISIIEASPLIVAMMDNNGLRYLNAAGRTLLDYGAEDDISHYSLNELMTPASLDVIRRHALPAAVKTGLWKGQTQFKTKSGSPISVSQIIIAHVDENDEVDFFSSIAEDITERLKAEQLLTVSRERLKYFMEESREAIVIHEDGIIIDFNNAAVKIFGYDPGELTGKKIQELYDISFHQDLRQKLRLKKSVMEEITGVKKNGTKFDIEIYSRPHTYRDREVNVVGMMDITARKAIERALRTSEVRLNAAVEGTHVGIWDWNLVTNKITFNDAWRRIYGYKTEEAPVFFDEWKEDIHAADVNEVLSKLRKHLYGETSMFQHIYRARHRSGKYMVIESKGKLIRDENNMPVSIVGTAVDITERQQMEDAVRKSQAQLAALLENREESIWSVDRDHRIMNFNKSIADIFQNMYGIQMEQGKMITEDLPAGLKELWINRYEQSLAGGSYSIVDRFDVHGEETFIEFSLNPIKIDDESIIGVSVLARNITQQKSFEKSLQQAKEAAEAANRTKSQFLANMSHEIRTPMNGIIGFTELLLQSKLTGQQHEYLEIVRFSADSLLALINDLLDISKIESGKLELTRRKFDLNVLLREVVRSFKAKAKEQHLKIELKVDKEIPSLLLGDDMRFQQVMVNLIGNAVKFSKDGDIRINAKLQGIDDNRVTILTEVIDEGIGIEKEKHEVIFEPFSQIEHLLTRKYGGTGLGLSIAKKLVNMMHGDIGVESEPGKGSRFYFTVLFEAVPE
jgi:PAS domain S-box-containing protein